MQNYLQPPYQGYRYPGLNNGFRVVPIANETEINSIAEDYSGIPIYFHNRSTNEIIIRQFDIKTGLTTMQKYVKSDGTINDSAGVKPDFDINAYDEKLNTLNERMDDLEKMLEKGGKNV